MSTTYQQLEPVIQALDDRIKTNLGAFPTDTAEGSNASFADGADGLPLKSLVVDINPVQDLHGYDNPWVAGGGKNLLDPSLFIDQASWNNIPVKVKPNTAYTMSTNKGTQADTGLALYFNNTNTQGGTDSTAVRSGRPMTVTSTSEGYVYVSQRIVSGEDSFQNYWFQIEEGSTATAYAPYENICPISGWTGANVTRCGKNLFDEEYPIIQSTLRHKPIFVGDGTYTLSTSTPLNTTNATNLFLLAGNVQSGANTNINGVYAGHPITAESVDGYVTIAYRNANGVDPSGYKTQLEVGSTATPYEPYNGQTIPIDWQTEAGTVYGGKLDVLSGALTVDRAMVDLGTLTWAVNNTGVRFYAASNPVNLPYKFSKVTQMICSAYKFDGYGAGAASYYGENGTIKYLYSSQSSNTREIYIHDDSKQGMTGDEFKTAMSGVQLVYELATPITYQLTPHEVKSLLGQNNIFADTGDSAVEYRADTKLYIERLTEPDADMIADANITSGQYFMIGNNLYRATANIASGSTVIVGTNAVRKSLSEALNEINS